MPDISKLLKLEISRVARKEIRTATQVLESQIRDLKKNVRVQQTLIQQLQKTIAKLERNSAAPVLKQTEDSSSPKVRVSPESIKKHRTRLGLSQQEFGQLLEVSTNTVVRWEAGSSKPRATHRQNIAKLRKMGIREIRKLLAA